MKCGWGCDKEATHYAGGPYAGDWAAHACEEHASQQAWSEKLPEKKNDNDKED
jgi:hypothetical protein